MLNYPLPRIIAHRGACGYAPENTLAAFRKAYELGAKWVEFDVKLTKDDVPIIFHDDTTKRTTNGPDRKIADLTWAEIKQLDAGSWFAPEFANEHVPTLEEVLEFLQAHDMQANIEIKPTIGLEAKTAKLALAIINKYWPESTPKAELPLLSSFATESLVAIRYLHSTMPIALVQDAWDTQDVILLTFLACESVNLNCHKLTAATVKSIKRLGYNIMVYTVNDADEAKQLFSWGVDGIFTNYFDRLKNL